MLVASGFERLVLRDQRRAARSCAPGRRIARTRATPSFSTRCAGLAGPPGLVAGDLGAAAPPIGLGQLRARSRAAASRRPAAQRRERRGVRRVDRPRRAAAAARRRPAPAGSPPTSAAVMRQVLRGDRQVLLFARGSATARRAASKAASRQRREVVVDLGAHGRDSRGRGASVPRAQRQHAGRVRLGLGVPGVVGLGLGEERVDPSPAPMPGLARAIGIAARCSR